MHITQPRNNNDAQMGMKARVHTRPRNNNDAQPNQRSLKVLAIANSVERNWK